MILACHICGGNEAGILAAFLAVCPFLGAALGFVMFRTRAKILRGVDAIVIGIRFLAKRSLAWGTAILSCERCLRRWEETRKNADNRKAGK